MNQIANMISTMRYMSGGKLKCSVSHSRRDWSRLGPGSSTQQNFAFVFRSHPASKWSCLLRAQDAYSLMRSAIADDNPVICIEHRWLYE